MLTQHPLDPHAFYDQWGNRYLVFSDWELWRIQRWVMQMSFVNSWAA